MTKPDPDDFKNELEAAQAQAARAEREAAEAKREVERLRAEVEKAADAPASKPRVLPWVVLCVAATALGFGPQIAHERRQAAENRAQAAAAASAARAARIAEARARPLLSFEEQRRFPGANGVFARTHGIIGEHGVVFLPTLHDFKPSFLATLGEERTPLKEVFAARLVDADSHRFYVVVGSGGAAAVRRYGTASPGEEAWTIEQTGVDTTLLAVTAHDDGRVFAVGEHGTILRRDPSLGWLRESSHVRETLRAVAVTSSGRVVAAGDDGVVLERDAGGDWVRLRSPADATLRAVVPIGDVVFIAGDHGTLLRLDGSAFSVFYPPVKDDFVAALPDLTGLVLATRQGTVVTFEPASPLRQWSIADVAPGEEIVGLSRSILQALVVTRSGRTFLGRRN